MIEHLYINNVALIKSGEIDFNYGLNIISGETGAGKSMVIDAVKFMLGQRAGKDFIRLGEDKAVVSGFFRVRNAEVRKSIGGLGVDLDDENTLVLERSINTAGKSTVKANGKTINLAILKEISAFIMDIHSQHDHQSLLNANKHMEILDAFCPQSFTDTKDKLSQYLREYKDLSKRASQIMAKSGKSGEKLEILKFEIEEIERISPVAGEEEELSERHKILLNSESLKENTKKIIDILYDDMGDNALGAVNQALRLLDEVARMDKRAGFMLDRLSSVAIDLEELKRDLSGFDDGIDARGYELKEVEARLEVIYSLKRKYGGSIEQALAYLERAREDYSDLVNADDLLIKINSRRKELNKLIVSACEDLHATRQEQAVIIESQIEAVLKELGMISARFKIDIESKKEFGINGNDKVSFLISPNLGEDLKELDKIASGGEMSRVMLALKTVISKTDNIETFVFDEIDTGVSGRTAQKVAEKLCLISRDQQILCITHLPQIAAMGDSHLLIEKITEGDRTFTEIKSLDRVAQIKEISRMLGGAKITDAVYANAGELKNMADAYKNNL